MSKAREPIYPGSIEVPGGEVIKNGYTVFEPAKVLQNKGLTKLEYVATELMAVQMAQYLPGGTEEDRSAVAAKNAVIGAKALLKAIEEDEKS